MPFAEDDPGHVAEHNRIETELAVAGLANAYQGVWGSGVDYSAGEIVRHNGYAFFAADDVAIGVEPGVFDTPAYSKAVASGVDTSNSGGGGQSQTITVASALTIDGALIKIPTNFNNAEPAYVRLRSGTVGNTTHLVSVAHNALLTKRDTNGYLKTVFPNPVTLQSGTTYFLSLETISGTAVILNSIQGTLPSPVGVTCGTYYYKNGVDWLEFAGARMNFALLQTNANNHWTPFAPLS
jgi:hypothetical protein